MNLGFHKHDHAACISEGVARADALCVGEGVQFTPVRKRVLELLLQAHRAMGAYQILDQISCVKMALSISRRWPIGRLIFWWRAALRIKLKS